MALWDLNLFKTMVIALIHCRNIIGSSSKSQSMKKDTATKRDTISSFDCLKPETKLVAVTFFFFYNHHVILGYYISVNEINL